MRNYIKRICCIFVVVALIISTFSVSASANQSTTITANFADGAVVTNQSSELIPTITFGNGVDFSNAVYTIEYDLGSKPATMINLSEKTKGIDISNLVCGFVPSVYTPQDAAYTLRISGLKDSSGSALEDFTKDFKIGYEETYFVPYKADTSFTEIAHDNTNVITYVHNRAETVADSELEKDWNYIVDNNLQSTTTATKYYTTIIVDFGTAKKIDAIAMMTRFDVTNYVNYNEVTFLGTNELATDANGYIKKGSEQTGTVLAAVADKNSYFTGNNEQAGMYTFDVTDTGSYRYLVMYNNATYQNITELFVYQEKKIEIGELVCTTEADSVSFSTEVNYNGFTPRQYEMVLTNYDANMKVVGAQTKTAVSGTSFSASVAKTSDVAKTQAVLIDKTNGKIVKVGYSDDFTFASTQGSSATFDNAVNLSDTGELTGKTVNADDYIEVSVIKAPDTPVGDTLSEQMENAFEGSYDLQWYGVAKSDDGYKMNIGFKLDGLHYIKVTRHSMAGTESVYIAHNMVTPETISAVIAKFFEDNLNLSEALTFGIDEKMVLKETNLLTNGRAILTDSEKELQIKEMFVGIRDALKDSETSVVELEAMLNATIVAVNAGYGDQSLLEANKSLITGNSSVKSFVEEYLSATFDFEVTTDIDGQTNVTNIGADGKIRFDFIINMHPSTIKPQNVWLNNITTGESKLTYTYSSNQLYLEIDKSNLQSNTEYEIVFSKNCKTIGGKFPISEIKFTFTTGMIANMPYKDGYVIKNVALNKPIIKGKPYSAGYEPTYMNDGSISTTTQFGSSEPVVLDLEGYYEISSIYYRAVSKGWTHQYTGITFQSSAYNNNFSEGANELFDATTLGDSDAQFEFSVKTPENLGKVRYLRLNRAPLGVSEFMAFAYVKKDIGAFSSNEFTGAGTYTFTVPVEEYDTSDTYYMLIAAYDENGGITAKSAQQVTKSNNELSASITVSDATKGISAILVNDIANLTQVTDGITIGLDLKQNASGKEGLSIVASDDGVVAQVIKDDNLNINDRVVILAVETTDVGVSAEDAFNAMTISDYNSKLSYLYAAQLDDGIKTTLDSLAVGKYYIRISVTDIYGVTTDKYFKYTKVSQTNEENLIASIMSGSKTEVKALLDTAINTDETISKDALLWADAATSAEHAENFAMIFTYVRDMMYPNYNGEITKISEIVNLVNASSLAYAYYNGDTSKATELAPDCGGLLGENYDVKADVNSVSALFTRFKANITDATTFEEVLDKSVILSFITSDVLADKTYALTTYSNALGIDLTQITANNVTIERVAEHIDISNLDACYTNFNSVYVAAVAAAKNEIGNGNSGAVENTRPGVTHGGGGGGGAPAPDKDEEKPVEQPPQETVSVAFSDMANHTWAHEAVNNLVEDGVLNGYADGTFKPNSNITRAEFIKMLMVATGVVVVEEEGMHFIDVPDDSWFFPYVKIAYTNKICNGVSEYYFAPNSYISRQDMAVLIYNCMKYTKLNITGAGKEFVDEDLLADYAKVAVSEVSKAGIINGYEDGTFKPNANATRAEAAVMIWNLIK